MKKEKNKSSDSKSGKESALKKAGKTNKEDASSTAPPEQTSKNENDSKSNSPEAPNANKDSYVRGETQKPVTNAYRKNWDSIFKRR